MSGLAPELDMPLGEIEIHAEGTVQNPPGVDVVAAIRAAEAARTEETPS